MTFVYDRRVGRTVVFEGPREQELSMPISFWEEIGKPNSLPVTVAGYPA